MKDLQQVKQRFGIIGNAPLLNRAIEICVHVAPTDISVLITGESGTGKENMPQIIHALSKRKHGPYIAVNCGAIPEGTIDSELFGHEKGSFTGAHDSRKGYFEVANGGTIFLDEVAELPLLTQVRLLRVLETGEYMRVGSSKPLKTNVRIIAATNVDMTKAIQNGKFREDLFYRLSSVPIYLPPLRDRREDVALLFRKFAADFAERYQMPPVRLTEEARSLLEQFYWPGNIRQLKNITEQISVIEESREITADILQNYLPDPVHSSNLPAMVGQERAAGDFTEREILYKLLFDMRQELNDLKAVVLDILQGAGSTSMPPTPSHGAAGRLYSQLPADNVQPAISAHSHEDAYELNSGKTVQIYGHEEVEETLSLEETEKDLIQRALRKHKNRRKYAARELGISERTLYRKIKEYNLK